MNAKLKLFTVLRTRLLPVSLVWFNFFIAVGPEAKSQEATPVPTLDAANEKRARQILENQTENTKNKTLFSPAEEIALRPIAPPKMTQVAAQNKDAGRDAADETVARR